MSAETVLSPCCGARSSLMGHLYQDLPDGPYLQPPVQLRRCSACQKEFRVDGVPFDAEARSAAWRAHREKESNP